MLWQPTRGILQPNQHWRRPQTTAAAETTVYDVAITGSDPSWGGFTVVQVIDAANLGAASGTEARLTVKFIAFSNGGTAVLYFAQKAPAGDAYDFANTPMHVLFSGTDITGDGATLTYVSDWGSLPEAYDETKFYTLAGQFTGATVTLAKDASSGDNSFFKAGADAATVDKSAYASNLANTALFVTKIEIR
jgi:hypothetical protein